MKLNFSQEVLVLPGSVLSHTDASPDALRVLIWLASDLSLAGKPAQLAKLADCDTKSAKAAIAPYENGEPLAALADYLLARTN